MRIRLLIFSFIAAIQIVCAQTVTIGLLYQDPSNEPGTVLFAPIANKTTYLIDKCGYNLHSWTSAYKPGNSVYLLEDGTLLRSGNTNNPVFGGGGGGGGIIEKIDWNGTVTWSYLISDASICQHHDIRALPNGNVFAIVWEEKTQAEAIAAGRDPAFLNTTFWNEKIMEIQPVGASGGTVVWEWNVWDHLIQDIDSTKANYGVVAQHPELVNINANPNASSNEDWLHLNAIDYNSSLDQIVLSSRIMSEIWILDHSTTTAEASSHTAGNSGKGGDLLYRWGNPRIYNRGTVGDQQFFGQHSVHWINQGLIGGGDLMVFNNGKDRPAGDYSSVDIIKTPIDSSGNYIIGVSAFQPDSAYWEYHDPTPTNLFSNNISGAQRLPNGHTLICDGNDGLFIEIDSSKNTVWKYKNPVNGMGPRPQGANILNNNSFRALFYEQYYSGFWGHTLSSSTPIELSPVAYTCAVPLSITDSKSNAAQISVYPNPFEAEFEIRIEDPQFSKANYSVVDVSGKQVMKGYITSLDKKINASSLLHGMYILQLTIDEKISFYKLVK